jgi:NAD-dependent deacetylase
VALTALVWLAFERSRIFLSFLPSAPALAGRFRFLHSAFRLLPSFFLFGVARLWGETGGMETTKLVELLRGSRRMLLFTGAGISTGSGIPDFRGPEGVWKRRQPVYYHDFMRSEAARVEFWDFKLEGWPGFREARPNATHEAIVDLERAGKVQAVVTQNIDNLHARAGTSAERLIELHGTNSFIECQTCGRRSDPAEHFEYFRKTRRPPVCECGGFLKSATISFGQNLRNEDLERAEAATQAADLVVALGSTLSVYPAANIPLLAANRGEPYVIINRGLTEHDDLPEVTLRLEGDVGEIFPPAVAAALKS